MCSYQIIVCYFKEDTTFTPKDPVLFKIITEVRPLHKIIHSVPVQVVPSPVKPGLHAHVKLPGMLLQAALMSQLSVFKVHSSSSTIFIKDAHLPFHHRLRAVIKSLFVILKNIPLSHQKTFSLQTYYQSTAFA